VLHTLQGCKWGAHLPSFSLLQRIYKSVTKLVDINPSALMTNADCIFQLV